MKRKQFFFLWLYFGLCCLCSFRGYAIPPDSDSLLWGPSNLDEPVLLDANAIFYWDHKITSVEELPDAVTPDTVTLKQLPFSWLQSAINNQKTSAFGKATLHIQVELPDTIQTYAFYIKSIIASYELWENRRLLGAVGKVGKDEANTQQDFKTQIICLPKKKKLDLFLVIANYYHRKGGGFIEGISIGEEKQLTTAKNTAFGRELILISILAFIGSYHLILFFFYPNIKAYLYFGLLILLGLLREVCIREIVIKTFIAELSYEVIQRFRYIGFYMSLGMVSMYFKNLLTTFRWPLWAKITFGACSVATLLTLIMPLYWTTWLSPSYQLLAMLTACYIIYNIFLNRKVNRTENRLLLLGGVIALIMSIHDILIASNIIDGEYKFLYGYLGFVLVQVLLLANRHKKMHLKATLLATDLEQLNQGLEERVVERTLEIQEQQKELLAQKNQISQQAEELQQTNEKLKELDLAKNRFFANISHEFRTPLTLILGNLAEIRTWFNNKEKEEIVEATFRNTQLLQQHVEQLLDLTKIESGNTALELKAVDALVLFRSYALMFESLFAQKKVSLSFHSTIEGSQYAMLDAIILGKVCLNLMSNAYKFTDTGGKVTATLEIQEGFIVFRVEDTGLGIEEEHLPYIFNRFYRIDESHHRQGSGIGLSLVKELVAIHQGRVEVESKLGKGSTFTLFIPFIEEAKNSGKEQPLMQRPILPKAESPSLTVYEPIATRNSHKPIVLIVEDNTDLRQMIKRTLAEKYQLLEAIDGERGIALALEQIPDLIISDVMMPRKDGFELCEILKKDQRTSHIPIILLTARIEMEDKLMGLRVGADDYLAKPFDQAELLLRIHNLIHLREQLRASFAPSNSLVLFRPEALADSPMEQQFMERLVEVLEDRYADEQFSVEQLAELMDLSKGQLNRKLKALVDSTSNKFIQNYRLQMALTLLQDRERQVGEVGLSVGFSSRAYFNKCFKERFGLTPKNYRDSLFEPPK